MSRRAARGGHNLLEVAIASFIFATAVITMMGIWATYHRALTKSKNLMVGSALAHGLVEQCLSVPYTSIPTAPPPTIYNCWTIIRGRQINTRFTATETFNPNYGSNPNQRYGHLSVLVTWTEDTGNRQVEYDVYLFNATDT